MFVTARGCGGLRYSTSHRHTESISGLDVARLLCGINGPGNVRAHRRRLPKLRQQWIDKFRVAPPIVERPVHSLREAALTCRRSLARSGCRCLGQGRSWLPMGELRGVGASYPVALPVRLAGIPVSAGGQRADVLGYRHRRAVQRSRGITRRWKLAAGTDRTGP